MIQGPLYDYIEPNPVPPLNKSRNKNKNQISLIFCRTARRIYRTKIKMEKKKN